MVICMMSIKATFKIDPLVSECLDLVAITNAYKVDNSNQYDPLSIFPKCELTHCLTNAPTYIEIPISPQK